MTRLPLLLAVVFAAVLTTAFFAAKPAAPPTAAAPLSAPRKEVRIANQPKVSGKLRLSARERREEPKGSGRLQVIEGALDWEVGQTAIIVCDMWDDHHCKIAAQRVGVLVQSMNQLLSAARARRVGTIVVPVQPM